MAESAADTGRASPLIGRIRPLPQA